MKHDRSPIELGDEYYRNPHAAYDRLRDLGPVHYVRFPDGRTGWLVTGYEAAKAAFADTTVSKVIQSPGARAALTDHGGDQRVKSGLFSDMMVFYDPPQHTRLRNLLTGAFAGPAVRNLAPSVEKIADSLLADMAADPREIHDLLDSYAIPLPTMVISSLLGVPRGDRDKFRTWTTVIFSGEHSTGDKFAIMQEFVAYIRQLIETKISAPGTDLLSELVAARKDDDRLTDRELVSMVFMLLVAGFETTAHLIGNAIAILLADAEVHRSLCADPGRIPDFVEEVLRYESSACEATFRYTTVPTDLGGTEIPAGELVMVSMAAADRDPQRFPDPQRFDMDRAQNNHIAFGYGMHKCVGAQLARLEAVIAITFLLDRYPDIRLAAGATLSWRRSLLVRGLTNLPLVLSPG
ncbi:cytochrome P450 [Nocardia sp. NBC_00508]|uniref:cytochrome P450 family protein n=1 Tax=Nocardia sp. NBC_00508 TaxID=2975992 RepID=UPI002E81EFF2|nr:cytochrome P450 [Nocardia sp. NBC_00508]WUD66558.1 cytochrome P450 [Nocardia sp. NBC_00508]